MVNPHLVLLVFAFALEVLSALGVPKELRYNLMAAGLACYFGSLLF